MEVMFTVGDDISSGSVNQMHGAVIHVTTTRPDMHHFERQKADTWYRVMLKLVTGSPFGAMAGNRALWSVGSSA